jgi:hypothetical protein
MNAMSLPVSKLKSISELSKILRTSPFPQKVFLFFFICFLRITSMIDLQYAFTWACVQLYNKNCDELQMTYFRANNVKSRSLA